MSAPMVALAVGASLGLGAASAPFVGGVLSKPITGEVVPTRITDLVGYLTAKGEPTEKGLDSTVGIGVDGEEISVGAPDTGPLRPAPRPAVPPSPTKATGDQKRFLAAASLGSSLLIAAVSFVLIRRVLR